MNRVTRQLVAVVTILFVGGSGLSCGGSKSPPSGSTSESPTPQVRAPAAVPSVLSAVADLNIPTETLLQAGRQLLETLPADDYDVAVVARTIGSDVDKSFAFVRDNLAFDPYAGSLRGAAGALMVRAGNSVDRSLLLAALLEANGHRVRLVQGILEAGLVEKLLAGSREPAVLAAEAVMDLTSLTEASGLSEVNVRRLVDTTDTASRMARDAVNARVTRQVDLILQKLKTAGIEISPAAALGAELLSHHVWVQVLNGGTWQDLDTSFRDARPGQAFSKPVGVPIQAASLPPDWYHTLRVRVLVNRPGSSPPESVLDHELRIDNIILHPIALAFAPQGNDDPYQAGAYQPVLMTNADPVLGSVFDLGLPQLGADPNESFVGALGGEDIGGKNAILSIGLELTLKGPGSPPKLITRQIVEPPNTQDAALRAAEIRDEIVSLYHIAAGVGPVPLSWIARQLMMLVEQFSDANAQERTLIPVDLMSFVGVVASGDSQTGRARRFYAQPLLVAQRTRFGSLPNGAKKLIQTLDILYNRMEFIDADPIAAVRQGVFETEVERAAFRSAEVSNTSTVFERATSDVQVIRPREPGKLNSLDFNEDAKLRIVEDLEAGYVVVVPSANVTIAGKPALGWWRVHPNGGETLGRMHSGEGQGAVEYILSLAPSVYSLGANIYCKGAGRTDGWCNPCLIAAAGITGSVIGYYGWLVSSHTVLFSVARLVFTVGTGVYGGVTKGLSCADWVTDGLLPNRKS